MDGAIDVVKGHPEDEVEEEHGASNNAHQEIYLLVIPERTYLVTFLSEIGVDPLAGRIFRREKALVVELSEPDDIGVVLTIAPGHDG